MFHIPEIGEFIKTDRTLVAGDVIKIIDKERIAYGDDLTDGQCYVICFDGTIGPCIVDNVEDALFIDEQTEHDAYLVLKK